MNRLRSLIESHKSGWTLEQPFHTDPEVFAAELEAIWNQSWLFAGFACEIPNPGDYFTYSPQNNSVIVIRGDEGEIYAHHNTCRHRGSMICTEPRGNAKKLRCPYHSWVYEKNGELRNARMMPDDFDKSHYGLHPVKLQVLEGVIFVSFAEAPPAFDKVRADLGPFLKPFQIGSAKVALRDSKVMRSNWKLIAENFRECYHCGPAHPEFCGAVIGANLVEDREKVWAEKRPIWKAKGLPIDTVEIEGDSFHYAIRYPLRPDTQSYSLDGKPVSIPMGDHKDHDAGVAGLVTYPNFWMDGVSDYIWSMRITPVDAQHSAVDTTWLVDGKAEEGKDYQVDRLAEFWRITGGQDWKLCENNQRGIDSSSYTQGPYAPTETDVLTFDKWCIDCFRKYLRSKAAG